MLSMIFFMQNNIGNSIPKCELIFAEKLSSLSHYGRFRISNLEIGQAQTMGIAIRRTLLGNILSLRISYVFIEGAYHEYSTIPGVRECIHDILANLKEIVFRGKSSTNLKASIVFKGPGIITSENLIFSNNQIPIEVLDKNQYIAKVEKEKIVKIDLIINSLRENKENSIINKLDQINQTQDFSYFLEKPNFCINGYSSPIRNENHYIEKSLTESNKENLIIEIWTNGSLTPTEALHNALMSLSFMFNLDIE
jgi:DNA-directed RNA polymerase subunit alpha